MAAQSKAWSTGALLLACCVLGGIVILELTEDLPLAPQVTAAAPDTSELPRQESIEYQPPPPDQFDVIAMRPLFSVSRRPFEPEAEATLESEADPDEDPGLPEVELIGVLIADTRRSALLAPAGGQAYWLNEGQLHEGWVIERIERNRATLRRDERVAILELRPD